MSLYNRQPPFLWRVGSWLHEHLRWAHPQEQSHNIIPLSVKFWMCASFDWAVQTWFEGRDD